MAKCGVTNIGGGGGIGSDEVSAAKENVLSGKTYVGVDTGDEIGTGTMANNGINENKSLNAGSSFLVKKGYHAQDFSVGANSLASQTGGTASAVHILSGKSAWVNGNKVTGSIPYQNAETDGDRVWATTASNWAGTFNIGVRNGHYLNGVNWVRYDVPTFRPENIKKGVNIAGLVGTWEGYVPANTDLYYRGSNVAGFVRSSATDSVSFDAGQITIKFLEYKYSIQEPEIKATINTVGKSYLNIEMYVSSTYNNSTSQRIRATFGGSAIGESTTTILTGTRTYSISLYALQMNTEVKLELQRTRGAIYRIWLS